MREFVDQLPDQSIEVTSAATTLATFVVSGTLTLFLLLYGPRMFDAGFDQIRDERRRTELRRFAIVAVAKTQRYAMGSLAGMVFFGLITYVIARLIDLPAPTPLAVVAGVLSALPYFGLVLGALPLLLLSAGLTSPGQASGAPGGLPRPAGRAGRAVAAVAAAPLALRRPRGDGRWSGCSATTSTGSAGCCSAASSGSSSSPWPTPPPAPCSCRAPAHR